MCSISRVVRLQFGNVALLPQVMAGVGGDSFKIVHGTDQAPPYTYVASYLWARYGFSADALIHFGTHGSLEYTPRKQVASSCVKRRTVCRMLAGLYITP